MPRPPIAMSSAPNMARVAQVRIMPLREIGKTGNNRDEQRRAEGNDHAHGSTSGKYAIDNQGKKTHKDARVFHHLSRTYQVFPSTGPNGFIMWYFMPSNTFFRNPGIRVSGMRIAFKSRVFSSAWGKSNI